MALFSLNTQIRVGTLILRDTNNICAQIFLWACCAYSRDLIYVAGNTVLLEMLWSLHLPGSSWWRTQWYVAKEKGGRQMWARTKVEPDCDSQTLGKTCSLMKCLQNWLPKLFCLQMFFPFLLWMMVVTCSKFWQFGRRKIEVCFDGYVFNY